MKNTKTAVTTVLFLLIFLALLTGCGSNDETKTMVDTDGNPDTIDSVGESDIMTQVEVAVKKADATIIIEGAKITPKEITVPSGEITIKVINKESTQQRIRIPFYDALVVLDVPAGDEGYATVTPKYAGRVAVELNGANLGGITVEK